MSVRIVMNGKQVTNPLAKVVVGMFAILMAGLVAALVIFLVLPLVGIAVTAAVGMVGVVLVALGIGIPLVILGGAVLGALLTPFAVLRDRVRRRPKRLPPSEE